MIAISGAATPFGKFLLSAIDNKDSVLKLDIKSDTDKGFFVDFFKTEKPSVFINLSQLQNMDEAEFNPEYAYNLHSFSVKNSAEAASEFNCLYVFLSSSYIFNGKNQQQYTEDDMPEPVSAFADSIFLGENHIKKSGCRYLILRAGDLYGIESAISSCKFLKKDLNNKLKVINDMKISPVYIPDAAQALMNLLEIKAEGIYNICNSGSVTSIEFIKKAFEIISENGNNNTAEFIESDIKEMRFTSERPLNTSISDKKLISKTGKGLRSWDEALKHYIETNNITEI